MVDVKCLKDCELQSHLEKLGYSPGPILQINIMLKGNTILSTEKCKELRNRVECSTTKPKPVDIYCLDYKPSGAIRCAARAPSIRIQDGTVNEKKDYCAVDRSAGSSREGFPVGLKLAVLGILIIVVFVYITVEKKPLFG
ncbi:PREDICTED: LEM domain-containing protein 1 isoform X2 [Propithecus coquereli]|uniref:LEM domain containing 1 n=1 Tax=Propithecus coquereli TaxID=379532 RepID=A0A2K6EQH1_PROCO|nr:PREDICTED: LEM domain-containing protein 1 isoform X2 [Propithecus coquereli]